MKKLLTLLCFGVVGIGCESNTVRGNYEGYPVKIIISNNYYYKHLRIYSKQKEGDSVVFKDADNDGIFEKMELDIDMNDPVKKFANFEIAEKIYDKTIQLK